MQIISRNEAIQKRLSRYFTGIPCPRGHLTYRYSKNGGCADCVNPKFESADLERKRVEREASKVASIADRVAARSRRQIEYGNAYEARYLARPKMRENGIVLHNGDIEAFTAMALLYARTHEPALIRSDVKTSRQRRGTGETGFWVHIFRIFPEDVETLREMERTLKQARMDSAALTRAGL